MRRVLWIGVLLGVLLGAGFVATAGDAKYMRDFEFIRDTVAHNGAAVASKKIDWPAACKRLRPRFAACENDVDHVKNVSRLLAVLSDSHTGVTRHSLGRGKLPGKGDGLFGGGLWIGYDRGLAILQGLMKGHPLGDTIPLGSVICAIDGQPLWLVLLREKRRITAYQGSSSDHSLFASIDNRFFPFGEKASLEVLFLTPRGKTKKTTVHRWGPGGKAFYAGLETLPEGVTWAKGAVSGRLDAETGYLRVTGSMERSTVAAFHTALDRLKGVKAIILDCRRMGGGGDGAAWEMAGRFFPKGVANGMNGRIEPSGSWQFDGPVVMLQDEVEVSSAETFTWAMSETKRVVSVGRPTGGWAIIPRGFSCPSGIVSFRLGVSDRPTPITRTHTEGLGWPPDVLVPYGPVICARSDPVLEIGREVLGALRRGETRKKVAAAYGGLVRGEIAKHKKTAPKLAGLVKEDLKARLALEALLLRVKDAGPPDALGVASRLESLEARARAAGLRGEIARLKKAVKSARAEIAAQTDFLAMTDASLGAEESVRSRFLKKHGRTAIARFARDRLWR